MSAYPPVVIREVGLRDGLQSIARVLPTAQKLEWIRDAYAAGQREIEVGSFVPRAAAAAAGGHRRARRLREDAAGTLRVGARAQSEGRASARSNPAPT